MNGKRWRAGLLAVGLSLACTATAPAATRDELPLPAEPDPTPETPAEPAPLPPPEPPEPPEPPPRTAGTKPPATTLAAHYQLEHLHQDMNVYTTRRYLMDARLDVEPDGRAALELAGTVTIETAELSMGTAHRPAPTRELPIAALWSGTAESLDGELLIHFQTTTAYQPALDIDVLWVCAPTTIDLDGAAVSAAVSGWRCQTDQWGTRPSGPAHALVEYMQVPLLFAAPREQLSMQVLARGGADHRSQIESSLATRRP